MKNLHPIQIDPMIARSLEEDWGYGDWTTDICLPASGQTTARIVSKEPLVMAGIEVATATFLKVDPKLEVTPLCQNGDFIETIRTPLLEVTGCPASILKAERVCLNFLGRMCGIASLTRQFVRELEGTKAQLLDTRKTTPGLRLLEKSATMIGGARNHRFGLCDGVIVKENHIRAAGGLTAAVERLLESLPPTLKIEVETTTLEEVEEAIRVGADIIMLDNMSVDLMRQAVELIDHRTLIEASGNITIDNIRKVAQTGVDFISTGSIIHSARWSDLSLLVNK